jgi:hypothetical protein
MGNHGKSGGAIGFVSLSKRERVNLRKMMKQIRSIK